MNSPPVFREPALEEMLALLLDLAHVPDVQDLANRVTTALSQHPGIALARLWLAKEDETCEVCQVRDKSAQKLGVHLVASAGQSRLDPQTRWDRVEGSFHRFDLGTAKIGQVAQNGTPILIRDREESPDGFVDPDWASREGIRAFCGQPLVDRGEVLGVLAVFLYEPLVPAWTRWQRVLADHLAAAVVRTRAHEEVARLRQRLENENRYLRQEVEDHGRFRGLVGWSSAMEEVRHRITRAAPTDAAVLILGESGTGKELVAREVHRASRRAAAPLIRVNCAAIPDELFEAEFFGAAQGAYSGAVADRPGRFEMADRGTLFLDEVSELPLSLQPKLLRVLQEGTFERLGEGRVRRADVRILAASNRDLEAEVAAGRFREDLYFRLAVLPITIPPLRHRRDDIAPLARESLARLTKRLGSEPVELPPETLARLQAYDWPGNVRELQNLIERALILSPPGTLLVDLPHRSERPRSPSTPEPSHIFNEVAMQEFLRANLEAAMQRCGWRVSGTRGAAALLGLKPATLTSRLKRYGLVRPGSSEASPE